MVRKSAATLMLTLVFAVVDFSRAIFIKEVITNLAGERSGIAPAAPRFPIPPPPWLQHRRRLT